MGSKGCVYSDAKQEVTQSAHRVKAVDTTAAGDTFTGYFVAGIAASKDMKEVIKTASVAAGIAVTREGAAPSIPDKKEVLDTIDRV